MRYIVYSNDNYSKLVTIFVWTWTEYEQTLFLIKVIYNVNGICIVMQDIYAYLMAV